MAGETFDFVIVGSGAGGLVAGITAKLRGLRPLVLEKTPLVGGSSAMSGGVLWLPNNRLMQREGIKDSREDALRYMENFVEKGALYSTPARREAFVDNVEPFLRQMEGLGMKYIRCHGYSDYYDLLPGGNAASRSIEAPMFDYNRLGAWKSRMRLPQVQVPVHTREGAKLMQVGITMAGKMMAARFAARATWNKLLGRAVYTTGGALQGRMLEIALRLGVDIWTEAALVDLDIRNGRVEGVHINHEGRQMTIAAPRGVLISAGGFAHNAAMRKQYHRAPATNEWTFSNPGDTGEALDCMGRAGAGYALMDTAWWNMRWHGPNGEVAQFVPEFVKPHGILVDHSGQRFVNEANSYMEMGEAVYNRHQKVPAIPAWLVMDMRARKRYLFGFNFPGKIKQAWLDGGYIKTDSTLAGLAKKCGIDPAGLEASVARFNRFAETGVDEDFHRGDSAYNRYYGDPTYKNPCLGTIAEPPFWAAPVVPGDVGTSGGVLANERAEVMRSDGSVIPGLYAAGNCAASLCGPYYVGAGQSIGTSSIFGFIVANLVAA